MGLLGFLRSVYDVDTLDTRFTTPSTVPYKAAVADQCVNGSTAATDNSKVPSVRAENSKRAEPSKWRTPEFILYVAIITAVVPYMFWVAYDVSRRMSSDDSPSHHPVASCRWPR